MTPHIHYDDYMNKAWYVFLIWVLASTAVDARERIIVPSIPQDTLEALSIKTHVPWDSTGREITDILLQPRHAEALKQIQRDKKEGAKIEVNDSNWSPHSIQFKPEGVYCEWVFFKPRLGWIWLTIKEILYDEESEKFVIHWKLWIFSKTVPMPLENACRLIEQILNIINWNSEEKEIVIPNSNKAKLILESAKP